MNIAIFDFLKINNIKHRIVCQKKDASLLKANFYDHFDCLFSDKSFIWCTFMSIRICVAFINRMFHKSFEEKIWQKKDPEIET